MKLSGRIAKLKGTLGDPIEYVLPIGDEALSLNPLIGKTLSIEFLHKIECVFCQRITPKSYSQGYCFPCSQKFARCDFCIVKPEKCHYHLGTCREPEWGETHCFIPHVVYLANTSGMKVGITRETTTRWIDQGAIQAMPLFSVTNRYQAGCVEVALKKHFNDKTHWRAMLTNQAPVDFTFDRQALVQTLPVEVTVLNEPVVALTYPISDYSFKCHSLNLDKEPKITGRLLGIKGQYLLFEQGVLNVRKITGYHVDLLTN